VQETPEARFAQRLRQAREAAGLSQVQLAALLGERHGIRIDGTAITRMEKGRRMVRLNEAAGLADILHIRLFDLLLPLPDELLAVHPDRLRERAARLTEELADLDVQISKAEADTIKARTRAGQLYRRRNEVQVDLAVLAAAPGFPDEDRLDHSVEDRLDQDRERDEHP
jgi:transcriptional regulator with XRE-family HTH domain